MYVCTWKKMPKKPLQSMATQRQLSFFHFIGIFVQVNYMASSNKHGSINKCCPVISIAPQDTALFRNLART